MAKCLNCGKEVKNKFCNTSCQNQYRSKIMQEEYNKNPNLCACCNTPLTWEQRRNKYCSSSCAAKVNNIGVNRWSKSQDQIIESFKNTTIVYKCSDEDFINYINNFTTWTKLYKDLGYSQRRIENRKYIIQRCLELKINPPEQEKVIISNYTKGNIFTNRKNWQSARSAIVKHAQKILFDSLSEPKCLLCGYDKHVEVAHIKAVSDFDDSATVAEINDLHNLVPLCPNHHWEFDHDCLSEENLKKINDYCNKL